MGGAQIELALRKLGDFSLQYVLPQGGMPSVWMLYNPWVEGDAVSILFHTFEDVILHLENL